ncbi:AsmA family protein [Halosquirtibacter laminarini]|uniref:AsmA family protein n=1 Tax=Halosquirtibacter laminarini TaxID=3374600 RepID=A0AC61NIS0_9BACT|nr:AsmA family protein [Prolixibacteraceae bacterium]
MNRLLKIVGIIIGTILLLMILVPFFFKDRITQEVVTVIEKNVDAKIYMESASLSLFKSFPNLNVSIDDFKVVNNNKKFTKPIMALKRLELDVNVSSLWKEKSLDILKFELVEPYVSLEITKEGKPNWDIVKSSEETAAPEDSATENSSSGSSFGINLNEVILDQATFAYVDHASNISFEMNNFNLKLQGMMKGVDTNLSMETNANISCSYEGVSYLTHIPVSLTTDVQANFEKMLFTIVKSDMKIESFPLVAQGSFQMDGDNYVPNIKIRCPHSSFKEVLGLVPDAYKSYLDGLDMTGKLTFSSSIEGVYNDQTYPKFNLHFEVKDGHMKYADLPESVENIQVRAIISKAQGDLDLTKVDVPVVEMKIGGQPVKASFGVTQPMSNPNFVAAFHGDMNLETLKKSIPVKMETLTGRIAGDMKLQGTMDLIEKEAYDKLYMSGTLRASGIKYKDASLKYPIEVPTAGMDLSAKKITLKETKLRVNGDEITFTGYLQNYFPYLFKDGAIQGNMSIQSKRIDTKTWMSLMVEEKKETTAVSKEKQDKVENDTNSVSVVQIPKNIFIDGFLNIDKVVYDDIEITDILGKAKVENQKAVLNNLSMKLWDGSMVSNGFFNTQNAEKPDFNFSFKANGIQIAKAYSASKTVQKYAPIANDSSGEIAANMNIRGALDSKLAPLFNTFNGGGVFSSSEILLKATGTTKEIANLVNGENSSDHLRVGKFSANFDLVNGDLTLHPVKTTVAGQKLTFYGNQNLAGQMSYQCDFLIPRNKLSGDVKQVVDIIPGASGIKEYNIGMSITGDISNPKVKLDLSKTKKQIQKELENSAGDKLKDEIKNIGNALKGLF